MKLGALLSGGKDSIYAIYKTSKENEIKFLLTIVSKNPESYMFHTSNIGLTMIQSETMGISLIEKKSHGEKEKELDDLKDLLKNLDIDGIVCGAIASNYQKTRVEEICKEFNLKLICPLWGLNQEELLKNMVKNGFRIMIVSVNAQGLDKSWLGRIIDEKCIEDLIELNKKYGINILGEGGEYETAVLDCPLFNKKIEITNSEIKWDDKTGSGEFIIKDAKLI